MEKDTIKIGVPFKGMVGHRGCAGLQTENTLKAFHEGGKRTYIALECDVHPTIDGYIVVNHDESLQRVAGNDMVICKHTLEEVLSVPFPDKETGLINPDLHVPLFTEYLDVCIKYNKIPVVELKQTLRAHDVPKIVEIVREKGLLDKVIFISFFPGYLTKLREMLPNVKIQFLSQVWTSSVFDLCVQFNFGIDLLYTEMTKEIIDMMHSKNLECNVYTVDDKEVALKLISWNIDFITSNICE